MKKYWKNFLSLIYPDLCYGCDAALVPGEDKLCLRCYRDLPVTDHHKKTSNPLMQIECNSLKVKGAFCYLKFNKNGIAQMLLHELKYSDNVSIGRTLGKWFGRYIAAEIAETKIDYIIPLPMHKAKERRRGYNQSEVLARGIEEVTGVPVLNDVLIRAKNITSQTSKSRIERWQNTTNIYEIKNKEIISGKNVFLLDDVITTGATVGNALEVLSDTQTNDIYFGCIASGK